jgi:hypothetical protein
MSYDAILAALRKRHPEMDLTEWEKYREIEFGPNGEVLPKSEKLEEILYKFEEPWYADRFSVDQTKLLAELRAIGVEATFDDNDGRLLGFWCDFEQKKKANAMPERMDRPFEWKLIRRSPFNDTHLKELVRIFPDITYLSLANTHITDNGLKYLTESPLPRLCMIVLGSTDPDFPDPMVITDIGMQFLGQLRSLSDIRIWSCPVTDEGVGYLHHLQRLELVKTKITVKAFRSIEKIKSISNVIVGYSNFSEPVDRETYNAIISLNGRVSDIIFTYSQVHPSFIRATCEIKSLRGYNWEMIEKYPVWGYQSSYKEISYDAILDALRNLHPDRDLTEWEKYREIEFGPNGEVLPKIVTPSELPNIRTWTTPDDKLPTNAKYLSADEHKVTLEKENGTIITVDLSKLSQEDRDYVKHQLESETKKTKE